MSESDREPCPACAEPIGIEAHVCPFCRSSALVVLALDNRVADPRARYQVARKLAALGPPFPGFLALQREMEQPRPRLAGGLTRAMARSGLEVLESQGLEGRIRAEPVRRPDTGGPRAPGRLALVAAAGMAGVALAGGALLLGLRSGKGILPDRQHAAPAPPSPKAATPPAAAPETDPISLKRALAGTVSLHCPTSVAAGFFVDKDMVLTNAHALCAGGAAIQVRLSDGREGVGVAVAADETLDLALVRVTGAEAEPLVLGDAGALSIGDEVTLVGSPVGLDFTVHRGLVSSLERSFLGVAYIQLDAGINPGNSGGPLLGADGHVVGVVSLKRVDADGIGLALPINYAYSGSAALLPDLAPVSLSEGFEAMLSTAANDDRRAAEEIGQLDLRPALYSVSVDEYGRLVAKVLRPSSYEPGPETFSFRFVRGTETLCTLRSGVTRWETFEPPTKTDPRVMGWLQRHGLAVRLYLGEAAMNWNLCSAIGSGATLELEGGHPEHSKIRLQVRRY
jgi:hypothetical protein